MKTLVNYLSEPAYIKMLFLRKALNITQKEMAALLCIDQSLLSKFERGEREIQIKYLEHFCSLFGITLHQFNNCNGIDILIKFAIAKHGLLNSTQLNSTQLNSTQLNSTQLNPIKIKQ